VKISPHLGYREAGVENRTRQMLCFVYEIEILEVERS
jgi:hypothetical protein